MAQNRYRKSHIYIATGLIGYVRDGEPKQRHMNIMVQREDKKITYETINTIRMSCIQRLHDENKVAPEDVKDFVILNISYLGHMAQSEFEGRPAGVSAQN